MSGDVGITIRGNETVSGATQKAGGAIGRLEKKSSQASKGMQVSWKNVALAIGSMYLAFTKIKSVVDSLIGAYDKQIQAETKVSAALRATGNVAKFTEKQLKKMASQMQTVTTFSDEMVLEAQAIMLTFKNIGHNVFPRAMEAAADLSAMFGQDLTRSSIMLSKALNDPVKGINAMTRVGVSFSAEATEMVKHLTEIGDMAGAQAIILQEVEGQVQGTAAAFAKMGTGPLRQLENKFGDLQEEMGKALLEGLSPLFEEMSDFIDFIASNTQVLKDLGTLIAAIGKHILGIIEFIINWREAIITFLVVAKGVPAIIGLITAALGAMGIASSVALGPIGLLISALGVLVGVIVSSVNRAKEAEKQYNAMAEEAEKSSKLIEAAQRGTLDSLELYYEAQSEVEQQIKKIRKAIVEEGREHEATYQQMLAQQEEALENINRQIEAEKNKQLVLSAIRGTLEDYADYARAIDLQTGKIAEWEEQLSSASELEQKAIGKWLEGQYKVLESLKERQRTAYLETEEYKKLMEARKKIEEEYAQKVFDLSASRLEVLKKEEEEALQKAREVGAEITNIKKYYSLQRRKIIEEETQAEIEAFWDSVNQRRSQEKAAVDFLRDWAGKATSNRISLLNDEKNAALKAADDMYQAMKKVYGPGTFEDVEAGNETIIDDKSVKEIENFIKLYQQAIAQIKTEYGNQISEVQKQINREIELGGKRGVELYNQMAGISETLLDPVERQQQQLEAQKNLLLELRSLLPDDTARLTDFQKEVAENIPALLEKIESRLRALADQPLVELAQQVAGISERFKDPLQKAKEAIEKDIGITQKYLDSIAAKGELYDSEKQFLADWGSEIKSTGKLLETLHNELKKVDKEMKQSDDVLSFWDMLSEKLFSSVNDFIDGAYQQYAQFAGKDVSSLTAEEQSAALSFSAVSAAAAGVAAVFMFLANQLWELITSTEAFQKFIKDLNDALLSVVEAVVGPLIEALLPLARLILDLVGMVANFLVPIFQMLGVLIMTLEPLWVLLGNILLQVVKIIVQLAPLIFMVAQILGQTLTPILNVINTVLMALGGIIAALQPVFDILGYVVDGVSRMFRSLWTIADFLLSPFQALGKLIYYIISFQWGKIGNIQIMTPQDLMKELAGIWKSSWSTSQYQAFAPDFGDIPEVQLTGFKDAEDLTPTVYGGNVSIQRAPDIYIYQYFQAPVIGEGGKSEIGAYVVSAIQEYVGIGGSITWEEN